MKRGFTLLELLIAITILTVLVAAIVPLFSTSREQAKQAKIAADLENIKLASIAYHFDTGAWPLVGNNGIQTCLVNNAGVGCPSLANGWKGPYLTDWLNDPYGNPYNIQDTCTGRYALSLGQDGAFNSCSEEDQCLKITPEVTSGPCPPNPYY